MGVRDTGRYSKTYDLSIFVWYLRDRKGDTRDLRGLRGRREGLRDFRDRRLERRRRDELRAPVYVSSVLVLSSILRLSCRSRTIADEAILTVVSWLYASTRFTASRKFSVILPFPLT